jgi:tRNA (Thr-GGU) A37 N-methylase
MNVINVQQSSSIIPEAITNVYQGINAITRIFRKGCEGIEQVNDVALLYMKDAIDEQHKQLLNRRQELRIA